MNIRPADPAAITGTPECHAEWSVLQPAPDAQLARGFNPRRRLWRFVTDVPLV